MRKWLVVAAVAVWWCAATASAELPSDLYSTQTKTATTNVVVTDAVLWTPASGKRIILQGVLVCSEVPATGFEVESSNVDVIPPLALDSYGCKTFSAGNAALWMGTPDATLTYSVSVSGGTVSVMAWGYEIQ